jgi:CheY-like chemotaxis protein
MSDSPFILVCDDNKSVAEALAVLIRAAGYRVQVAQEALQCLAVARKDRPSMILMDIMMPGLDGATASDLMKDVPELDHVPIILISAMPEDEVREKAKEAGVAGYLLKPCPKDLLLETVRRWAGPLPVNA